MFPAPPGTVLASSELNDRQAEAAAHGPGPLLVVAGAGTGKTSTLAARLAHLVEQGADPSRICLLTFSRRAASELLARAGRWVSPAAGAGVVGGTFHSVAQRLLHRHGAVVGLGPGFTVLDAGDAVELMALVRHDLGFGSGPKRFPRAETLVGLASHVANARTPLREVLAASYPWCGPEQDRIREVFSAYTRRKRAGNLCDFDDLLLLVAAMGTVEAGARVLAGLFDHVLVDEYQDVNSLQADMVGLMCPGGRGLTAVGDPAQAIYGFRAATTEAITGFRGRYPDADVVYLEQNYRSTVPILAVANQVLAESDEAMTATLWSEAPGRHRPLVRTCDDELAQAEAVCQAVLEHRERGVALRAQAVLFRTGHHSRELELVLARHDIPYVKYGGLRFLEASHVKDLVALVRILDNPYDELAWFRVLRLVEGIGPATARSVMARIGLDPVGDGIGIGDGIGGGIGIGGGDAGATSPLARLLAAAPAVAGVAAESLGELRRALARCVEPAEAAPGTGLGRELDELRGWLDPVVTRRYDHGGARIADLDRLAELAGDRTRSAFLADLTLDPPTSTADLAGVPSLDDDWLVLSTVHSAKGGEWDVVHVIHAADGMFPSDLATGTPEGIAEERRLFYVALTRARHRLEVNFCLRYHHHRGSRRTGPAADRHGYAQMSRFLSPAVLALVDHASTATVGPSAAPVDAAGPGPVGGVAALDAMLEGLWA